MIICKQNEGVAELRRTYFHCVDATDGITPATGEAGGQPQLSFRGGSWQDSSGTLTSIGNGRYYLELHPAEINTSGVIESRYKSANTAETLGIPIQVMPWNPYDTSNLGLSTLSSFSFNDANVNANIVQTSGNEFNVDDFKADVSSLALQDDVTSIKAKTDKMTFDVNNRIESSGAYIVDANLVRVSGELIHIDDLKYSETDIYYADIKYVKDMINSQDEIGVQWFKNMTPVTSVTNPYISLYNTSNGSAIIEHTSMTAAGTTGAYRYDLTSNLFASGEPYLVITSGTIDGALREWRHVVGIDKL